MQVASKELCEELYKISGWEHTKPSATSNRWYSANGTLVMNRSEKGNAVVPAYDLGYLLRKLPTLVGGGKWKLTMFKDHHNGRGTDWYMFSYVHVNSQGTAAITDTTPQYTMYSSEDDTPEDAACKLAIELFKQNILTLEDK